MSFKILMPGQIISGITERIGDEITELLLVTRKMMKEEINTRELAYIQIISSWKRQMILVANPYIVLTRCQALVQSALQMWLHQFLTRVL